MEPQYLWYKKYYLRHRLKIDKYINYFIFIDYDFAWIIFLIGQFIDIKNKLDKANRNRPSRWQDPDPIADREFPLKPFNYGQDQDMRINR